MKRSTESVYASGEALTDTPDAGRGLGHFAAIISGAETLLNDASASIKKVGEKAVKKVIPGNWGLGG